MHEGKTYFGLRVTSKLLILCFGLISISYLITFYLFWGVKDVVETSERIVNEDFQIILASEQIVDTLLLYLENNRKYQILARKEYLQDAENSLRELQSITSALPDILPESSGLRELRIELAEHFDTDGLISRPDADTVGNWAANVSEDRLHVLDRIDHRLHQMNQRGSEVQKHGFLGLVAATSFGLIATLGIALGLNRSFNALRKGISRITGHREYQPIFVRSRDELRELAGAFNEMADRLLAEERMRSEFIAMLSHEIRTPLTSIREAISLVQDGVLGTVDDRQVPFLEIARNETRRLSDLLSRLMHISALRAGELNLDLRPASPCEIINEAIQRIRPISEKQAVSIEYSCPGPDLPVLVDRDHIQQVLFNLLGNALKFSPPNSTVRVTVSSRPLDNTATICIIDQGPGIPDSDKNMIFQRFYQGMQKKTVGDGLGLGLYISKMIILEHSGDLWMENSNLQGGTFCFTLPLVDN